MGRLIYSLNVSLDGFVETADQRLDWATVDDELHRWFNDQTRTLDATLYGRRMYELMAGYWPAAATAPGVTETERDFAAIWNAMPKVVFSRTLTSIGPNARLVAGDVAERLAELRAELPGDLDVAGPTLAAQFLVQDLVDELHLVIHPVVLGGGMPFFPSLPAPIRLVLLDTRTFASGVAALRYRVVRS